jgi:hypothetical protein
MVLIHRTISNYKFLEKLKDTKWYPEFVIGTKYNTMVKKIKTNRQTMINPRKAQKH